MERLTGKRHCEIAFYEPVCCKFSNKKYIHNVLKRDIVTPVCEDKYYNSGIVDEDTLKQIYVKLGKYEDLEEQIGCPLEVRCNLDLNDRIIDRFGIEYIVRSIGKNDFIGYDVKKLEKNEFYRELFKWKEYKITWWLKADKSE